MAVPDFQTLMLPVLRAVGDSETSRPPEIRERVAKACALSAEQLAERLPSGRQGTFENRVAWSFVYLQRAGLIEAVKRGTYQITDRGRVVLAAPPARIDREFLRQFPEFAKWRQGTSEPAISPTSEAEPSQTPLETIEATFAILKEDLRRTLLARIRKLDPVTFERLILSLLVAMGYGGGRAEMARQTPRSNDDGIDGVIKEDALGLDLVLIQAKRYNPPTIVGRPEMQSFVGSLAGNGTSKGIFVTTSTFNSNAKSYVDRVPNRIILIDGDELAQLMIDYKIGVRVTQTFELKDIDENVFEEG